MLNCRLGAVHVLLGETAKGERALQLALDIAGDAGSPWIEVQAHVELGRAHAQRGRSSRADGGRRRTRGQSGNTKVSMGTAGSVERKEAGGGGILTIHKIASYRNGTNSRRNWVARYGVIRDNGHFNV